MIFALFFQSQTDAVTGTGPLPDRRKHSRGRSGSNLADLRLQALQNTPQRDIPFALFRGVQQTSLRDRSAERSDLRHYGILAGGKKSNQTERCDGKCT